MKLLNRRISLQILVKICSVCHKISAMGKDHLDCIQKRKIEMENEEFKQKLPEKLDVTKNANDLHVEIKAILEHMTKEKERNK